MPTALVIYVLLGAYTLLLICWALASAAARISEHARVHRIGTAAAALLLPPAVAAAAFGPALGEPGAQAALLALPPLVLLCTWANVMTLRDQGFAARFFHAPILAWNLLLASSYAVRAAQDLFGFDLGTYGTAITGAFVEVQTLVGSPRAAANPHWHYLPFALPLWLAYRARHWLVLVATSAVACGLLALLLAAMPGTFHRAQMFRAPIGEVAAAPAQTLPRLGLLEHVPGPRQTWLPPPVLLRHLGALGADQVVVALRPEFLGDDEAVQALTAHFAALRQARMEIVVTILPPGRTLSLPAKDLDELAREMAKAQWLAAERLQPDLLVLFSGPYGNLADAALGTSTLEQWQKVITRCAKEARQANAKIRTAVALEGRAPHTRELFRWLRADESPVDVVAFAIEAGTQPLDEIRNDLGVLEDWSRKIPGTRPLLVLTAGTSPQSAGGELGQWHFLRAVLEFAARARGVEAVVLGALADGTATDGLMTARGRERLAVRELRRLLAGPGNQPPR